jgi:uncharacterized protein YqgV (UPF0045/DUF77 family)
MALVAEFTVEPFVEGAPGPHVQAALAAAEASGLVVEFGPFGTAVRGDDDGVLAAAHHIVVQAMEAGATRVSLQIQRV